jgi:hypothetical protein
MEELNLVETLLISVITAWLTAHFTAKNIKYQIHEQYENDCKKMLISQKLHSTELIYGFLHHFDTVTSPDGYYSCMNDIKEMENVLLTLQDIEKNLIWFSTEVDDKITELANELESYRIFMTTPKFTERSDEVLRHKDAFADLVRIDAITIRRLLYKTILEKDDVIKTLEQNEEKLKNLPYLQDREKHDAIWFDGMFAAKHIKRFR